MGLFPDRKPHVSKMKHWREVAWYLAMAKVFAVFNTLNLLWFDQKTADLFLPS